MATKNEGVSCYDKAADDEPIFVLRAQDGIAPMVVRMWADMAEYLGVSEEKVEEARLLADQMEEWPNRRDPT